MGNTRLIVQCNERHWDQSDFDFEANSDYFKNQATDEPATGVAVALFDEAGNVMKNNEEGSDVDISSGAATIPFTVKMVKSGDADPTKGTVQTTVTYNVTYH